ncbi:MAG: plasmid stabilization protein [Alteromonadaceae bacterium]|nr:MAG: plasmid stabilization protein [Alteromonadaceae bacterium]
MQVKWLNKALLNLNDEAEYIAQDDPTTAKILIQRIFNSVKLLSDNPAMGNAGRILGTRELVAPDTRYIIPYRVRPQLDRIEVLRVFHTSRHLPKHW